MDFTIKTYILLMHSLKKSGYNFQTVQEYIKAPAEKVIILRHDVDKLPQNSLQFAEIQSSMGIKASYYFRIVPQSFNEKIILEIASLGHEIGYHYETMDTASSKYKFHGSISKTTTSEPMSAEISTKMGPSLHQKPKTQNLGSETRNQDYNLLIDAAYTEFCQNLETFRKLVPIETICMHGSPRSRYDNRDIWKKYNYKDLGIIGEPYFDLDFTKMAYYTDTGRMWDGDKYSVRDKVTTMTNNTSLIQQPTPVSIGGETGRGAFPGYHKTTDIISAINSLSFPEKAMFTFHPQRWTNKPILWVKELVAQKAKNVVKRWFFVNLSHKVQ
jgi:hypothetical protein